MLRLRLLEIPIPLCQKLYVNRVVVTAKKKVGKKKKIQIVKFVLLL